MIGEEIEYVIKAQRLSRYRVSDWRYRVAASKGRSFENKIKKYGKIKMEGVVGIGIDFNSN
jgi:hypothetical protein